MSGEGGSDVGMSGNSEAIAYLAVSSELDQNNSCGM
jgi:hypothetical protein